MVQNNPEKKVIQYIPPKGEFQTFLDEEHYKLKLKEWGLSSAKDAKKEFWYKEKDLQVLVKIQGYESYGTSAEFNTIVIEFNDGNLSCIHPAYLKEMQQASFNKESVWGEKKETIELVPGEKIDSPENKQPPSKPEPKKAAATRSVKEKTKKVDLPADKVHFTAKIKQFAMTYNPFTEENDEVVILETVNIIEPPLELEYAWCSHSKTLKKLELAPGELLEFDGKITAKKLSKGKDVSEEFIFDSAVIYKINNPSKILRLEKSE